MHAKDNNKFNFLKVLQLNMINKYQVYQIFKYENSGSFVLVHSSKDINYNDLENKCSSIIIMLNKVFYQGTYLAY